MGADAKKYQKIKLRLFAVDLVFGWTTLLLIQCSGLSRFWAEWAAARTAEPTAQIFFYALFFFHGIFLIGLPLSYYSGFVIEQRFQLSRQSRTDWVRDKFKSYALSLAFFLVTVELFYGIVRFYPRGWWLWAGVGWLGLTAGIARVLPTLLIPLFYRTRPLRDAVLRQSMERLREKTGLHALGAYEISLSEKTKKANAALVGLGKSRRILFGDTLIESFSVPEIEMVAAHEIGHHVQKHILKSLTVNFMTTLAGFFLLFQFSERLVLFFGASGLEDPAIFPALLLAGALGWFLTLPLQNFVSRHYENEADRYALTLYPDLNVFQSLLQKLGRQNLSDPDPPRWVEWLWYDHPCLSRRLENADRFLGGKKS